ncbi:hypothetical protein [Pedobacter xixiisoli]|uniref:Uncharacterized protein n=1 Tax=Pedobacter xixiisoli TaxID=1476464 RepID=A0A286A793_9SPHI|nr:hypothetical protein [Pedobacter xixiisoli]SOD17769.1 hypothetical protein SAMN06297358_2678 [Pedobacter xixiisoli]
MENIEREFTEYLYNRYVDAVRNDKYTAEQIYDDLLRRCVYNLPSRKYSRIRRYARELVKKITLAKKNGISGKLLFVGEEGKREFEEVIEQYRQSLIEQGLPEETIDRWVIDKKKYYGND